MLTSHNGDGSSIGAAPDRDHAVEIFPRDMPALRLWLNAPNGALWLGRVTFEAVEHGGIFVRTRPYTADRKES